MFQFYICLSSIHSCVQLPDGRSPLEVAKRLCLKIGYPQTQWFIIMFPIRFPTQIAIRRCTQRFQTPNVWSFWLYIPLNPMKSRGLLVKSVILGKEAPLSLVKTPLFVV